MTGYGRSENKNGDIFCTIEIKTINSRYNDTNFRMPNALNSLENELRRLVKDKISRGKIDIEIVYSNGAKSTKSLNYDKALAKEYVKILNDMMAIDSMIESSIDLNLLAQLPDIITVSEAGLDEEETLAIIKPTLEECLDKVCESREKEGANLKADLLDHIQKAQNLHSQIVEMAPKAIEENIANTKERIQNLLDDVQVDEARFLNEVAYLSDRYAIDEELSRLDSHFKNFYSLLEQEGPIGRKLDFLLQEFNREANTIGSKINNAEISSLVVELKSEIEKLREQVQNIE